MHSQSKEEQFILEYFKDFKGRLLDVGSNDGETFSNSRQLILNGWSADLIEPSPLAFAKLKELYKTNLSVRLHNVAISYFTGNTTLYESGEHIGKGDVGLLSSLDEQETRRWKKETFTGVKVRCITIADLFPKLPTFDFVSVDAEANDVMILKQIDLTKTSLICVEHNSQLHTEREIRDYCRKFGLSKEIYMSAENIILGK